MSAHGHEIYTLDIDSKFHPSVECDILSWHPEPQQMRPEILWASPPCTGFSVASIGTNWTGGKNAHRPKTSTARLGIKLAKRTRQLITELEPVWWFIENPRGLLRKMPFMDGIGFRHTISYCQYGDFRMKPTDVWTNAPWWKPRPICKNGDKCHESAPRGSKTGTQGINGARNRGIIPPQIFEEILSQYPYSHD